MMIKNLTHWVRLAPFLGTLVLGPLSAHCYCLPGEHTDKFETANAASITIPAQNGYGPFGEVLRATGPMAKANPLRFSTKCQADETDPLYCGYRYYNASTGRWISRDPIAENGGLNIYGFVANDPLRRVDGLGLLWPFSKPCCCCCAEDILFQDIQRYQVGFRFGHSFSTMIKLKYVRSSSHGDCKLEWWERSQSDTPRPEDSYRWTEMFGGGSGPRGSSFKGWMDTPRPCPGSVVLPDKDEPAISTLIRQRRVLDFNIRAYSTPGCPCKWKRVTIRARHLLSPRRQ